MTPKIQTTENQYFDSKINLFKCHVPQKYTGGIAIFLVKTSQDYKGLVLQPRTVHSQSYNPFPCELGSSSRTSILALSHYSISFLWTRIQKFPY